MSKFSEMPFGLNMSRMFILSMLIIELSGILQRVLDSKLKKKSKMNSFWF